MAGAKTPDDIFQQLAQMHAKIKRLENTRPEAVHRVGAVGEPAFANSWVNYDASRPAGFYRQDGHTYLEGIVKDGTVGLTAFTLPAAYWPNTTNNRSFAVDSNGLHGLIIVWGDGRVSPYTGSNAYFFLDGINFRHA
jgi:hypothetical protein